MKRKFTLFFFFTLFLLITFFINGCSLNKPYAVKIGADAVSAEEFKFYYLLSQRAYEQEGGTDIWETTINGVKAEEVAKERALESLTVVKVSCENADSFNILINEEDKNKALEMTKTYSALLGENDLSLIGITDEQMLKIMEETILYRKVYDEVTKNVIVSDSDFNLYYNNYLLENDLVGSETPQTRAEEYDRYTEMIKSDVFYEQFHEWSKKIKVVKNAEVWDTIKILPH